MSFSQSFRANAADGVVNLQEIKDTVASQDAYFVPPSKIPEGHQRQITIGARAIELVCAEFPDKTVVGSLYGHANEDGTGNVGFSYAFEAEK